MMGVIRVRNGDGFRVGRRLRLADGDDGRLLFMDLAHDDEPMGGLVVRVIAVGFMQSEGLNGSADGEEHKGRRDEDTEVKVNEAGGFQEYISGHI